MLRTIKKSFFFVKIFIARLSTNKNCSFKGNDECRTHADGFRVQEGKRRM